jgi:hypothetical protein
MQNSPAEGLVPDTIDIEADHKFQDVFNMLWLYVAFSSMREYATPSTHETLRAKYSIDILKRYFIIVESQTP